MGDLKFKNSLWIKCIFWCFISISLLFFLQVDYAYYFYYIEQFQLFPLTFEAFYKSLNQIQGFAFYTAGFITQFYQLPYMGAICTTLMFLLGSLLIASIFKKTYPTSQNGYYILATLPMILFIYMQLDSYYFLGGTTAFLIMLATFYLFLCITKYFLQLVASIVFPILLFWLAGPAASLFVIGLTIWTLSQNETKKYFYLLSIPIVGILSYVSVHWAWQSEYVKILVPDVFYSDLFLGTTNFTNLYFTWFSFPILFIIVGIIHNAVQIKTKWNIIWTIIQFLTISGLIWGILEKRQDPILLTNMQQDFYLRNKNWNQIINHFSNEKYDLQTLNILNLSLIQEGKLDNDLFKYPQQGGISLLSENSEKEYNIIALAELHYHIGNIGAAQKYAYEGYIISQKGNPRLLKRLIETNLIFGSYLVAEKYITLLEETLYYKEWAQEQRRFLFNDTLIESDPNYGPKRKGLRNGTNIAVSSNFKKAFEQLAINNPENPIPLYYLTMIYLLNKDLQGFHALYEKYYHTEIWPKLSLRQQEAIIAWYESEPNLWIEKGISFKIQQRFLAYKEQIQNISPYTNIEKQIASSFGDTFWYYLLFKK